MLSAVLVTLGLIVFGIALARPTWLPAWARVRVLATATQEDSGLYCKEHGVPEKFCTLCHEELRKTLMLCKEHGNIPEDICTKCHPEVEKKYNIEMCPKGHGLPRAFCVACGKVTSASAALPDDGWCATHNKPEAECPECANDPRTIGPVAAGETSQVCRQPLADGQARLGQARPASRHPDGRGDRGDPCPPPDRQCRDRLRRQPLRRDQPACCRVPPRGSSRPWAKPFVRATSWRSSTRPRSAPPRRSSSQHMPRSSSPR